MIEIPADLKWIIEHYPEWLNPHYDHVSKHECEGFDPIVWHTYPNEKNCFSRKQYEEAKEILNNQ